MASYTNNDIRSALQKHISSLPGLTKYIVYDNVLFDAENPNPEDPTERATEYISTEYIPTINVPAVRGVNPQLYYQGIFTVTVFIGEGTGVFKAENYATIITEGFKATSGISYTNLSGEKISVSIRYVERQRGLVDTPWYFIPINIGWYIYN